KNPGVEQIASLQSGRAMPGNTQIELDANEVHIGSTFGPIHNRHSLAASDVQLDWLRVAEKFPPINRTLKIGDDTEERREIGGGRMLHAEECFSRAAGNAQAGRFFSPVIGG